MRFDLKYPALACLLAGAVFLGIAIGGSRALEKKAKGAEAELPENAIEINIGGTSISDYVIVSGLFDREAANRLSGYIEEVSGVKLEPASKAGDKKSITLVKDKNKPEGSYGIDINDGNITITGIDSEDLKRQVDAFSNRFLGIAFAGETRQHVIKNEAETVNIPSDFFISQTPWMEEREPIICLWKTTAPRGVFYNSGTSLGSEILSYSDDMLYNYVRMMAACGYTGIQVTDMCSAWAYYGNYEFVHDRIRFMADAAHSMGMKFTLWVWGAEFNGYGWIDTDVDYYGNVMPDGSMEYERASENPKALESFDKYYDIYASLADVSDRVIAHYNDPGNLTKGEDIAFYASMLRDKFRAVNPDVDFGVSCYTNYIDFRELNNDMGGDVTIYLGACTEAGSTWAPQRGFCRDDGIPLGIWSWNLTEMEIDQLAEMNVNANLIKDVYTRTAEEDIYKKPTYWSEMESYHVLNLFSHYVAGNLLSDPNLDPDYLLTEISKAVVGDVYADELYDVLNLIQDARTGSSWESFRWEYEDYYIKSNTYDFEGFLTRGKKALSDLDEMIDADLKCNTIPLPMSVSDLLKMIKPHVRQIVDYSQFREDLEMVRAAGAGGADNEKLQADVDALYKPVSEYNVITGVWGIPEAKAQYELTEEFCKQYELEVPQDPTFIYFRKQKIYDEFVTWQRKSSEKQLFTKSGFQWGVAYGPDETVRLTEQLVEEGLLTETEDGKVFVTDWERYRYDD